MFGEQKWKEGSTHAHRPWWRGVARTVATLVVLLAVFALGVGVGQGRVSFHASGPAAVSGNLPDTLDYSSVNKVYDVLRQNYDGTLTESQLLDGLKHGLAESTKDPYTEYFTASENHTFIGQLNNSFSGIGASLGKDKDNNLIIMSALSGFPAEKAGLKAQDIIVTINGENTSPMSLDEAVSKIRGPEGSKVTLQVVRNHSQQLNFVITRQNIQIPSVTTKMLDGDIGYIQIISFSDDTTDLIHKAASDMAAKHVKGIVLDLRDNPGGLLDAAVAVSSEWLPQGKLILQEKRGNTVVDSKQATGGDELAGIPTVVLINEGSASASEITAGALHDNKAAYLIGVKSYGKGVVQDTVCITGQRLADGSCSADMLKVTVASWYRPNGQNINKKGITPDQTVKEPDNATPDNDPQLQAAIAYLDK